MLHEKHNNKCTIRLSDSMYETISLFAKFNCISFSRALEMILEKGVCSNVDKHTTQHN
jgi:predicted DNA binding CopG/RHH family protein